MRGTMTTACAPELAPKGLGNPGWNTCYLNSVLQAVHASRHLCAHTLYIDHLIKQQQEQHAASLQPLALVPAAPHSPTHRQLPNQQEPLALTIFNLVISLGSLLCSKHGDGARGYVSHPSERPASTSISSRLHSYTLPQEASPIRAPSSVILTSLRLGSPRKQAEAPLVKALAGLLGHMSPVDAHDASKVVPLTAVRGAITALEEHLPEGSLRFGQQEDALEAMQALFCGFQSEVDSLISRMAPGAGLSCLTAEDTTATTTATTSITVTDPLNLSQHIPTNSTAALNQGVSAYVETDAGEVQKPGSGGRPAHSLIWPEPSTRLSAHQHTQLPATGWASHSLACCQCGNSSLTQVTPLWSLTLKLPHVLDDRTGLAHVLPGSDLLSCLKAHVQPCLLREVTCSKCSLTKLAQALQPRPAKPHTVWPDGLGSGAAGLHLEPARLALPVYSRGSGHALSSLSAAGVHANTSATGPATMSTTAAVNWAAAESLELQQLRHLAERLAQLPRSIPLPDLELDELLKDAAGKKLLKSCKVRCNALQRAGVCRLPKVLMLHMQRSVWSTSAGQCIKVHGKVTFPVLVTDALVRATLQKPAVCTLPLQPHAGGDGSGGDSSLEHPDPTNNTGGFWRLASVISHLGGTARSGHYVVYRRGSCQEGLPTTWYRVSDASVTPVAEEQVLECQASILVYEHVLPGGV